MQTSKKILTVAILAISANSVSAMEIKPFVGIDASQAQSTAKTKLSLTNGTITSGSQVFSAGDSYTFSENDTATSYNLKIGATLDTNNRVYIKNASYSKNELDLVLTTVNYERTFDLSNAIKPYAGVHIGQATADITVFSDTSTTMGAQIGALFPIKEGFEVDFNVSYTMLGLEDSVSGSLPNGTISGVTLNNVAGDIKLELEDAVLINLGLNYNF